MTKIWHYLSATAKSEKGRSKHNKHECSSCFLSCYQPSDRARDYPFCLHPVFLLSHPLMPHVVVVSFSRIEWDEKTMAKNDNDEHRMSQKNNILWWNHRRKKSLGGRCESCNYFVMGFTQAHRIANPSLKLRPSIEKSQKEITRTVSFVPPAPTASVLPLTAKTKISVSTFFYCKPRLFQYRKKWETRGENDLFKSSFATRFHQTDINPTTTSCLHDSSPFNGLLSKAGYISSCGLKRRKQQRDEENERMWMFVHNDRQQREKKRIFYAVQLCNICKHSR